MLRFDNKADFFKAFAKVKPKTKELDFNNLSFYCFNKPIVPTKEDLKIIERQHRYPNLLQLVYEVEKFPKIDEDLPNLIIQELSHGEELYQLIDLASEDTFRVNLNDKKLKLKNLYIKEFKEKNDKKFFKVSSVSHQEVLGFLVESEKIGYEKERVLHIEHIWKKRSALDKEVLHSYAVIISKECEDRKCEKVLAGVMVDNVGSLNLFQNKWAFKLRCVIVQ